ncbi:MAG: ABC transporter permease [bacterium]
MKFIDYIRFGLKNIWRQKARTILTIIAVMIGATSVVLMLTIIFGAKDAAISQIESAGALTQVAVSGNTDISSDSVFSGNSGGGGDTAKLTDAILTKVNAIPHVSGGYAQLSAWVMKQSSITDASGKKLNLSNSDTIAYQPSPLTERPIVAGRNLTPDDDNSILISQETLIKMGYAKDQAAAAVGQTLNFTTQGYVGDDKNVPLPPTQDPGQNNSKQANEDYYNTIKNHQGHQTITVVGVLAAGVYDREDFIPLSYAKKLMTQWQWQQKEQAPVDCGKTMGQCSQPAPEYTLTSMSQFDQQGYSSLVLKVDSVENVAGVAAAVKKMGLGAATAQEMIDQIMQIFKMISIVFGAIGGISLFVAAIGVINTMIMATLERTREIGVMRACGATRAAVRRLFTFEAALLGFWGGLFGCAIAYAASLAVSHFAGSQLSSQGIPLSVLGIQPWLIMVTIATTTIVGMLAGYWPAVRAARMNPVEALRYE